MAYKVDSITSQAFKITLTMVFEWTAITDWNLYSGSAKSRVGSRMYKSGKALNPGSFSTRFNSTKETKTGAM